MEDEIWACLVCIFEDDNEARDLAVDRLREMSANDLFPELMMTFFVDDELDPRVRELAISVCQFYLFAVVLPPMLNHPFEALHPVFIDTYKLIFRE
jgi:hypothetical protein